MWNLAVCLPPLQQCSKTIDDDRMLINSILVEDKFRLKTKVLKIEVTHTPIKEWSASDHQILDLARSKPISRL